MERPHDEYDEPFGASEPFAADLTQFDDPFAEAEVEDNDYDPVPDGKYQATVEQVELTRTKTTGRPMLKWTLRILAPQCRGRKLWRNNVIAEDNIKWLKKDLYTCGLEIQRVSDLPANLHKLLDIKLEIAKVTRGDNENIYLNKLIVMDDGAGFKSSQKKEIGRF
ncbi:MAG: DUF669 domain-containing protein [Deltaproteobacteria bacterium]|nr:DUF669 domain-containing protein [Deltaproteobacteria bacterium]